MKRISKLMTTVMFAIITFVMTSCTEDQMVSMKMQGTWVGNMYVRSEYNGRVYQSTYTELEFSSDPFRITRGYGYWVDHYSNAPWDYIANHIRWEVVNGIIYIDFIEDNYQFEIRDYRISHNRFVGVIYQNGVAVEFNLRSTDQEDWNQYGWGYDYWDTLYYSQSRSAIWSDTISTDSTTKERPYTFIQE